jgi:pimeloyl-ACP methyl ester carboxylesterase
VLKSFSNDTLFGARYGAGGPGVLALHGWRRTHLDFEALFDGTSSGREVDAVALDLPGFGATPEPPAPWGSADYAAALRPVLVEIGAPVVVLGHSFGGRVALHLQTLEPDLVRGLVLCGVPQLVATDRRPHVDPRYRLVRALARAHLLSAGRLEAARERFGSADYRAARGVMREVLVRVLAENYEEQLAALSCPVEFVWGERDTAAPLALATEAASRVAGSRLTVLPGVGHLVPSEAPDALAAALERLGC